MGSLIGDYVHYHTMNYLNYGIAHKGQRPQMAMAAISKFKAQFNTSLSQIKAGSMTTSQANEWIQNIEFLFRPPDNQFGVDSNVWQQVVDSVLMPWFQEDFVDCEERLALELGNIFSSVPSVGIKKIKDDTKITAATIMSRKNNLERILNEGYSLIAKGQSGLYSEQELNLLRKVNKELDILLSELDIVTQRQLAKLQTSTVTYTVKKGSLAGQTITRLQYRKDSALQKSDKLQEIIDKFNWMVAASKGTANLERGVLFERVGAAAFYMAQGLTGTALREAIENAIKEGGDSATKVQFDESALSKDLNAHVILGNNYTRSDPLNENIWISTSVASKDKIDLKLQFNQNTDPINLSLKNVNLTGASRRPIGLVQGAPLFLMLANLQNHELVNHYLNQHVDTVATGAKSLYIASQSFYNETSKMIMLGLFEEALRGYKSQADKANVFVINNNQRGSVSIFNMDEILNKIILNFDSLRNDLTFKPDVSSLYFRNIWDKIGPAGRIEKLLAEVMKIKMEIAISPDLFTNGIFSTVNEAI